VEPDQRGSIAESLSHLFPTESDPVAIAGELARVVHDLEAALSPILGVRGVAALYQRSLHLTRAAYPWLAGPSEAAQPNIDLQALQATFAKRAPADAACAATALLQSFHDLLATLIGQPLSARLLDPVWAPTRRRQAAQDNPP
jgi:hypothetical protein